MSKDRRSSSSTAAAGTTISDATGSSLPVTTLNNVRVYNISGNSHRTLPDWLIRKSARSLKKDAEWTRRVELIQDLEFPEASLQSKFTPDGKYVIATGTYKPQFRVYELAEMSMKFDRHTDAETVAFDVLSEDWTKLILLQANRAIEFHGPSGVYHSVRTPRVGRAMVYDAFSCDLVVGASDSSVYRFNLDRGQYLAPFETEQSINLGVNAVARAPLHGLYGFGTESGTVVFWDRRDRKRVGLLRMVNDEIDKDFEISSLKFLPDGITWAAGTSTGQVSVFDLRSSKPLYTRDHHYGFPIKEIKYHAESENIISYDRKAIRIWNRSTGNLLTTVEMSGGVELNHVNMGVGENGSGDGFLLCSVEDRQMQSFFIPALGPAPRWASFLENLTEEMEEGQRVGGKASISAGAVYDNYKFVTKTELATLNLDHLIGTSVLRAYMHGYFVDLRLYEKAKSIANPFAYEEYMAEQRRVKLEAERAGRIKADSSALQQSQQKKKGPVIVNGVKAKVNTVLAERLQQQSELLAKLDALESAENAQIIAATATASQPKSSSQKSDSEEEEELIVMTKAERKALQAAKSGQAILDDSRFSSLFTNPDFAIDEETEEFRSVARRAAAEDK